VLCVFTACSKGEHSNGKNIGVGPNEEPGVATSNGRDIPFESCPTSSPSSPSSPHPTTDADPAARARMFVPITAAAIRVCQYAADDLLTAAGVVREPNAVERLVAETNRLTTGTPASGCPDVVEPRFFLTFSNGNTDIDVAEAGQCGTVSNGKVVALGSPSWRLDLAHSDLTIAQDHQLPMPTSPGPHPATGQFLTGTLAGDGICFWVESADHTRTDVLWPDGYTARAQPRRVIDFGFHVIGVVGQDVVFGGSHARVSASVLERVDPSVRRCLPPANCRGDACDIWLAA